MISSGKASARKLARARILLKADSGAGQPGWDDATISQGVEVGRATVERVRQEFVEEGLKEALERRKPLVVYSTISFAEFLREILGRTPENLILTRYRRTSQTCQR